MTEWKKMDIKRKFYQSALKKIAVSPNNLSFEQGVEVVDSYLKSLEEWKIKKFDKGNPSVWVMNNSKISDFTLEISVFTGLKNLCYVKIEIWEKRDFLVKSIFTNPVDGVNYVLTNFKAIKESCDQQILEAEKKARLEEMAHNTIEILVKAKMKELGYTYNFEKGSGACHSVLEIKINGKRKLRVLISNKNFATQIEGISEVIRKIEECEKEHGVKIGVKSYGSRQGWVEP